MCSLMVFATGSQSSRLGKVTADLDGFQEVPQSPARAVGNSKRTIGAVSIDYKLTYEDLEGAPYSHISTSPSAE